jgi:hypothetical protein
MFPLMPGFARPLNTSEVSGRDLLRGLYKDSLTYDNPLRFQAKAVITLPIEENTLAKVHIAMCLKRTELYPVNATPLALSVRSSQAKVSN